MKPRLDEANIKLLFISIGTAARAVEFSKETEFPSENLYADPENICYDALNFHHGVGRTFFNAATPSAMKDRFLADSAKDLQNIMPRWKPWLPPKQTQGLQQGGLICFDGKETIYFHKDEATGAHADFDKVLKILGA